MVSPGSSQPNAESRLQALGVVLPKGPHPLGAYVESVQSGNLLFLSGMLPVKDGKLQFVGRLGKELDESRRLHSHNPARGQADARSEVGWQRRGNHVIAG